MSGWGGKCHTAFLCVHGTYSSHDSGAQMEIEHLARGAHVATCIPGTPPVPQSKSSF